MHGVWEVCSGTLIHPRVFLTAGHCTVDLEGYHPFYVTFDVDAYQPPASVLLEVEEVITHPDYGFGDSNPSDVGALYPWPNLSRASNRLRCPSWACWTSCKRRARVARGGTGRCQVRSGRLRGTLESPPPVITYYDQRQMAVSEYVALTKVLLDMSQNRLKDDSGTCFGDSVARPFG